MVMVVVHWIGITNGFKEYKLFSEVLENVVENVEGELDGITEGINEGTNIAAISSINA